MKERVSLIGSKLEKYDFQLLPFIKNTPEIIEKTLNWQENFSKQFLNSKVAIVTELKTNESFMDSDLFESIKLQSYTNYSVFLVCNSECYQKSSEEVQVLSSFDSINDYLDEFEYILFVSPNTVLHPTAVFTFLKQTTSKTAEYDFLYSNSVQLREKSKIYIRQSSKLSSIELLDNEITGGVAFLNKDIFKASNYYSYKDLKDLLHLCSILVKNNNYLSKRIPLALFTNESPRAEKDIQISNEKKELFSEILASTSLQLSNNQLRPAASEGVTLGVVVPFKDEAETTINCINSILKQKSNLRIITYLVSNNSSKESINTIRNYLDSTQTTDFEIIEKNTYFNFASICNYGAKEVIENEKCDYVLFLNNDVELKGQDSIANSSRWLELRNVGAVGGELEYPDGTIQSSGIAFTSAGPMNIRLHSQNVSSLRECDAICFAYCMLRVDVWQKVGGLDEFYCPNGFGDALIGKSLSSMDYALMIEPSAKAIHYESKTRKSSLENLEMWEMQESGIYLGTYQDAFLNSNMSDEVKLDGVEGTGRKIFWWLRGIKNKILKDS